MNLRYRKNDPDHNLDVAVQRYIKAHGGKAIVIGGVQVIKMPDDRPLMFTLGIRITGTPPKPVTEATR